MGEQVRWLCDQCGREWVWAHEWDERQGCPLCRGTNIHQVKYAPDFPGADIPRKVAEMRPPAPAPVFQQHEQPNTTLVAAQAMETGRGTKSSWCPELD